ncbi:MAG: hypothetical protein U5N26_02630 [Candidatus Marinimicrobia bacterium]|nr:hypothetical protein [Candidatus Neomarinimicrobiota bacterium]
MEHYMNIRQLSKDYRQVRALSGVDLDIPRGRIVGLLGKETAPGSPPCSSACWAC